MNKSKIMGGFVILLYLSFALFQFTGHEDWAYYLSSLILPIITGIYFLRVKDRSLFFTLFLVLFSISDLLVFAEYFEEYKKVDYYLGNGLYILAYIFLLFEICKSIRLIYLLKNYTVHMLVLTGLSIYIVYVLQVIVNPFVSESNEYYVELVYNIILFTLLSAALLGYFYKDNIKALYLFLGVLSIVFAEVIWVAYTYISERNLLNFLSATLYLVSFYFLYKQSELIDEKREEVNMV